MYLLFLEPSLSISERVCTKIYLRYHLVDMHDLALEFVTDGLARATSHRVLWPKGTTPRYSVPFSRVLEWIFGLWTRDLNVNITTPSTKFPFLIHYLKSHLRLRNYEKNEDSFWLQIVIKGKKIQVWLTQWIAVNFSEFDRESSGKVDLIGRVK